LVNQSITKFSYPRIDVEKILSSLEDLKKTSFLLVLNSIIQKIALNNQSNDIYSISLLESFHSEEEILHHTSFIESRIPSTPHSIQPLAEVPEYLANLAQNLTFDNVPDYVAVVEGKNPITPNSSDTLRISVGKLPTNTESEEASSDKETEEPTPRLTHKKSEEKEKKEDDDAPKVVPPPLFTPPPMSNAKVENRKTLAFISTTDLHAAQDRESKIDSRKSAQPSITSSHSQEKNEKKETKSPPLPKNPPPSTLSSTSSSNLSSPPPPPPPMNSHTPPPPPGPPGPPGPPPPPMQKKRSNTMPSAPSGDKSALLSSIQGFNNRGLKKTETNDRSSPIVSASKNEGGSSSGGGGGVGGIAAELAKRRKAME